ncbi:MAG: thymidine phosphorylase [Gemmatimonadota bacterium]|nr:MAG: thymidine phosphorylase [Gemmatimonadota bacterium]
MLITELIETKRDGGELPAAELRAFLDGFLAGRVADYQMSAFLMAAFLRGLSSDELAEMTRAMIASGRRLDFRDGGPTAVDKHSTGGVGDKVSLVLAPLLAAYGLRVPMMSGRGLGHTGGTVDKLDAIPGFRTRIGLDEFVAVLAEVGCAMISQTEEIAPLDGRLYALRDVTGTVPSIPLIASSIISKKVAEGIEALVLDVKCGSGAFMVDEEGALQLARTLVDLATEQGLEARALVTDMETPLGRTVGNALEVAEAIETLKGGGPADLREVTLALSAEALVAAGAEPDPRSGRAALEPLLDDGSAAERFARLVERQGGDPAILDDPGRLPKAPLRRDLEAPSSGWLVGLDARQIGLAAVELGAGRTRVGDAVDPAVGFALHAGRGDRVEAGQPLVTVHAASEEKAEGALRRLRAAVAIGGAVPPPRKLLRYRVTPGAATEV